MADITCMALFGKLNPRVHRAMRDATVFCRKRQNPYVEPDHMFAVSLSNAATDDLFVSRCTDAESDGRVNGALLTNTVLPRISTEFLARIANGEPLARITLSARGGDFDHRFE